MQQKFNKFFVENNIYPKDKKFLIAISGGSDSVVMAELFLRSGYTFGLAHCNFMLRNEESDKEEFFVESFAKKNNLPFFVEHFNTKEYSQKQSISIQMAARDLRYDWFEKIAKKENYNYIVTAHNFDDQIETFFINLSRGTGISGLKGILPMNGNIIRPLLSFPKEEIESFAVANNIDFCHDSSNDSDKYLRNKIRHHIIPVLKETNPNFYSSFEETLKKIVDVEKIYHREISNCKKIIIRTEGYESTISIKQLLKLEQPETYLFEFISEYGFNFSIVKNIIRSLSDQPGKIFYSETHCLLKDRENLIIRKRTEKDSGVFHIDENEEYLIYPLKLKVISEKNTADFIIPDEKNTAVFDKSMLKFPLKIRKWKMGDFFFPLGMKGKKKLSDFFIDEKFTRFKKENIWLVCSGDDIIWIAGQRIDDRYKVNKQTKELLILKLIN